MPRRIALRSSFVSDALSASRCSQPSQASAICARACSSRRMPETPGVVFILTYVAQSAPTHDWTAFAFSGPCPPSIR